MSATYVGKCEQRIKRAFWYVYAAEVERHPTAVESIGLRRRRYRSRTGESDLESGHRPLQLVRTARYVASSAHYVYALVKSTIRLQDFYTVSQKVSPI